VTLYVFILVWVKGHQNHRITRLSKHIRSDEAVIKTDISS